MVIVISGSAALIAFAVAAGVGIFLVITWRESVKPTPLRRYAINRIELLLQLTAKLVGEWLILTGPFQPPPSALNKPTDAAVPDGS